MSEEIHSCSFYCDRPECVRAQRDSLRDRFVTPALPRVGTLPPGPMCTCTDPPTAMKLTLYMDAGSGMPVRRTDATCPKCGITLKGI